MADLPPRRWLIRSLLGLFVLSLLLFSGVMTVSYDEPMLEANATESTPKGDTIVSSQGWNARGVSLSGRPARLVSVGSRGDVEWTYNGSNNRQSWFYDVDPLPNGNLLVVNPYPGTSVVYEFDPETQERVWTEKFNLSDIHDIDLINGDELLVAGINYDTGSTSNDSVFIYNRTTDKTTWEWKFKNYYPNDADKGIKTKDWTHVNDIDEIRDGEFLISVRNMDQVIVVNRSTKMIEMRLGEDDNYGTLYEQHNPTYLESKNGTPTILVADSENDRIVEYTRMGGPPGEGEWERTWTLTGDLNWPRDADRLPNGNTLVTDTLNHRVMEVTPAGKVVWEMYAPWAPYDAERIAYGDEAGGPTIRDQNASGTAELHGGSGIGVTNLPTVPDVVSSVVAETPLPPQVTSLAERWRRVSPWFKPTWMPIWAFSFLTIGFFVVVLWAVGEGVYQRHLVRRQIAASLQGVRNRLS
ncbi:aryl-sulfate sulfotransferase [Halococcus sp. AFM35]|uniref:aryl-sulfate sulfotransferase n=1 Tax=Halococcus sp. AFM35 TaxID=3421653 RepID=UPI003EB8A4D0